MFRLFNRLFLIPDGVDGGSATTAPAAASATPAAAAAPTAPAAPTLHEVKRADGTVAKMTTDELIASAQKVGTGDEYLREARETLNDSKSAVDAYDALLAAKAGDQDAVFRVLKTIGFSDDDVTAMRSAAEAAVKPAASAPGKPAATATPAAPDPRALVDTLAKGLGVSAGQLQTALGLVIKDGIQSGRSEFDGLLADNIKKDAVLGFTAKNNEKKLASLVRMAGDVVARKMGENGGAYKPQMLPDALQEVRARAGDLGVLETPESAVLATYGSIGESFAESLDAGIMTGKKNLERPKDPTDVEGRASYANHRLAQLLQQRGGVKAPVA